MKSETPANYSSSQVAMIAEVSLRQLQWWDERHVVEPRHAAHRRYYDLEDVIEVVIVAELRRRGFSLARVRKLLRPSIVELRKYVDEDGREILPPHSAPEEGMDVRHRHELMLVTDGRTMKVLRDPQRIIQTLKAARTGVMCISVTDALQRIRGCRKRF